jgi:hypothetical protein
MYEDYAKLEAQLANIAENAQANLLKLKAAIKARYITSRTQNCEGRVA